MSDYRWLSALLLVALGAFDLFLVVAFLYNLALFIRHV